MPRRCRQSLCPNPAYAHDIHCSVHSDKGRRPIPREIEAVYKAALADIKTRRESIVPYCGLRSSLGGDCRTFTEATFTGATHKKKAWFPVNSQ